MEIVEKFTNTHEKVLLASDPTIGYRGIIAVHSTVLGPAVGGTRFWNYASNDDALADALRLSRGMTYKTALAGLPLGGGKSIIIGNNKIVERDELLRAHGRFVDVLKGRYITAEDVGTSPADMEIVRGETQYVAGLLGIHHPLLLVEYFEPFRPQPNIFGVQINCQVFPLRFKVVATLATRWQDYFTKPGLKSSCQM